MGAWLFPLALILALPLMGSGLAGKEIAPFLSFPPMPGQMAHAPFSPLAFLMILALVLGVALPLVRQGARPVPRGCRPDHPKTFPRWGWAALAAFGAFWILAWTRLDFFAPLQAHTFFPLWLSLILVMNAVAMKLLGSCALLARPRHFIRLFFVSALFWWTFEYLNRFVGNWIYSGSTYGPWTYFFLATLSFSTVLPAVESLNTLVLGSSRIRCNFRNYPPLPLLTEKGFGAGLMAFGALGLLCLPAFPDPLFFMLWLAPLALFWGWQIILGRNHALSVLTRGDCTPLVSYALAALGCGVFWEVLNFFSLAKWTYAIPYVQVLPVFEMPLLGYAGYLLFGPACAMVIHLVYNHERQTK